jgi:hypothetical protein
LALEEGERLRQVHAEVLLNSVGPMVAIVQHIILRREVAWMIW